MYIQILETTFEIILGKGLDGQVLAGAFQHFSCSAKGEISVRLEINAVKEGEELSIALSESGRDIWYSNGQLDFIAPNLSGFIDLERKFGRFTIRPNKLVNSVAAILRCITVVEAIARGGFVLHASSVVDDNFAYVFTGPSGVGKTTMASSAHNACKINDDTVLIAPFEGNYYVLGTPLWEEPEKSSVHGIFKIKGVFLIEHGSELKTTRIHPAFAAVALFSPPNFLRGDDLYTRQFENCAIAASMIPCCKLEFPNRPDVFEELKKHLEAECDERMDKE